MRKLLFLFGLVFLFSCHKSAMDDSCGNEHPGNGRVTIKGVISWSGPVESDGYGWTLLPSSSGNTSYLLKDLPAAYQSDSLVVEATLEKTEEQTCSWGGCFYRYKVLSIKPQ